MVCSHDTYSPGSDPSNPTLHTGLRLTQQGFVSGFVGMKRVDVYHFPVIFLEGLANTFFSLLPKPFLVKLLVFEFHSF